MVSVIRATQTIGGTHGGVAWLQRIREEGHVGQDPANQLQAQRTKGRVRERKPAYAQPIANLPGLRWKVWIINEAQREAGGIYLFDGDAAVQAFLDGPIVAEMKGDPTLSIKAFDVIAELTTITHGPVK